MRSRLLALPTVLVTLAVTGVADAQTPVQIQLGPSTPSLEFGAHIHILEMFGDASRTFGGRFAKRHTDWLVSELAYDKTSLKYEGRETRLLVAAVRLQDPHPRLGKRGFFAFGVAKADGLSYSWSPMVSAGAHHETPDGVGAIRIELQYFTRGRNYSSGFEQMRLLMGIRIGIP